MSDPNDILMRSASIAANAVEEMREALGRGGTRPTDADMATQFRIGAALAQMERNPPPSTGVVEPVVNARKPVAAQKPPVIGGDPSAGVVLGNPSGGFDPNELTGSLAETLGLKPQEGG